jgi:NAD-dependent dihydropyrimidine dehydrogenase PreA subunit
LEGDQIYRELQRHLDRGAVPFPATESGVEIRILKQLFTPEEARAALWLSAIPEPLKRIQRRSQAGPLGETLDRMAAKGSINKMPGKNGPLYFKAPLVVGMYENQVDRLTPELELDVRAYLDQALGGVLHSTRTPQMRTVTVNKSIKVEHAVASHNYIRQFVEASPGPFAVLNCICRQGKDLTGEPCRHTQARRNCLMIEVAATMMTERGLARPVSKEEMLELLEEADREGLVLQPQNTQNPIFVCVCCGCCCGVLTSAKRLPRPAEFFQTDFVAEVDQEACQSCGVCETRCQMDAIASSDGPPKVLAERCIGCGLCVTTCPSGAARLLRKEGRKPPPSDTMALYSTLFQERYGKLGATAVMAGHFLGRKF